MDVKNNIILAMDLMDLKAAEKVCESINEYIDTIKIGYPLTLAEGLSTIGFFKDNFDYKVICDYKVADIPATNEKIANQTFDAGADAIICHGFVGPDSVDACKTSAEDHGKEVFLLTEMSHPGAIKFLQSNAELKCLILEQLSSSSPMQMRLPEWALKWELKTMSHHPQDLKGCLKSEI